MKENKPPHYENKFALLNDKVARTFFEEILCSPAPAAISKLTQVGFGCFKNYMLWVNQKELSYVGVKSVYDPPAKQQPAKFTLDNYQGLSTLLAIAFRSEVPAIREQANEFLVFFIDKLCLRSKLRRREITEKAFELALDNVKDLSNVQQVRIALKIIDSIIERYIGACIIPYIEWNA